MTNRDNDLAQLIGLAGRRAPLPEERARRIRAAVAPVWMTAARGRRRRRAFALALAAGLAAAAAGVTVWLRTAPPSTETLGTVARIEGAGAELHGPDGAVQPVTEGLAIPVGARLVSGGGRTALDLAGGGSLRIDAASRLQFAAGRRLELESGAVYVDSGGESSSAQAWRVTTELGDVVEIGTRFEVRLDSDGLRVRVREGSVILDAGDVSARAEAAEELRLEPGGALRRGVVALHGPEWDWLAGLAPPFALAGRELGEFLEWVSLETGWTVRFADHLDGELVGRTVIRGPADSARPGEALPMVLAACELAYRLEDGVVTIYDDRGHGGDG